MELAEGKNPYDGYTAPEVIQMICYEEPPVLSSSEWSTEFVDFVEKCLVKDVNERWSMSELMNVRVFSKEL